MFTSDNDELLRSKIDDAIFLCSTRPKPCFLPFMSERRQAVALQHLKNISFDNFLFYGGYEESQRKMLGIFYDAADNNCFPLSAMEFRYRKCDSLTHRDFLGALMSLGIERDTVGDILISTGRCVVFLKSELYQFVESQILKIGSVGVLISAADTQNLPASSEKDELVFTVSSLRLDNIVAAVCKASREKSKDIILSGNVCVNYLVMQNISFNLKQNDVFTIRGRGKFVLNGILGKTKKERFNISVIYFR